MLLFENVEYSIIDFYQGIKLSESISIKPPKSLLRQVGRAIADYDMIREGDRVMLGLSGGKDSLSLLHTLLHLQRHAPIHFEVEAMTVDPQMESFRPEVLRGYMEQLGVNWHLVAQPIMEQAQSHMKGDSFCSWCARIKRGIMYTTLREKGFTVLALGQQLDDLAESFLMSAFHEGRLNTMKAHYTIGEGDLRVIRPLVYVRERQLRDFASEAGLPVVIENCPACYTMPTQRAHMKALLRQEEEGTPHLFKTLLSTMKPLMARASAGESS